MSPLFHYTNQRTYRILFTLIYDVYNAHVKLCTDNRYAANEDK